MPDSRGSTEKIDRLQEAFETDGFEVISSARAGDTQRLGLLAMHHTKKDKKGERKRAYYVEGEPREMGYLMGFLAEPFVHVMSENYIENYIRKMLPWARNEKKSEADWPTYEWLVKRVNALVPPGVPPHPSLQPRVEEIEGMVDGCKDANPRTEVSVERLWALNAGVDCLFSILYEFKLLKLLFGRKAKKVRPPTECNGLAILNDAKADATLFARDFMFAACDVFQDAACHIIYNPLPRKKDGRLPIVAMSAPGFVGSIAAMNAKGVAAGVDVVHGGHNDPDHLGINSLMLVRHAVEGGHTIDEAVKRVWKAPRGVSWLYPMVADGGKDGKDRACVVEASATPRDRKTGKPVEELEFWKFPRKELRDRGLLPDESYLKTHASDGAEYHSGVMIRWDGYDDPCGEERGYCGFNERLWRRRLKTWCLWKWVKKQFGKTGMINPTHRSRRCPSGSYFAPLRAEQGNIVLTSNHYITPEMRLTAMDERCNLLDLAYASDSQWRYDMLNAEVQAKREEGRIDYEAAKGLINFLEPPCAEEGKCPFVRVKNCYHYSKYHNRECLKPTRRKKRPIPIEGAVSLFDLSNLIVESYYGYYGDDWVRLQLKNYVKEAD